MSRELEQVPFVKPSIAPDATLLEAIARSLQTGRLSNEGPEVRAFEAEVASFLGASEVVAVASGSSALLCSALALRVTGKAILPSFTFVATLSAVLHAGLEPVFCDVDAARWTMDPDALEATLAKTRDVALVVPVSSFGVPAELGRIAALAGAHGARVLYDDAHGFGSAIAGARHMEGPVARAISLHATKVLPAGEGGLVVLSDAALAREVRRLGAHGLAKNPLESTAGINARMNELCAAVARHSLSSFDEVLERRREDGAHIRARADAAAGGGFFVTQSIPADVTWSATNLAVRVPTAESLGMDRIIVELAGQGVEARRYFHPPLHHMERFREVAGADRLPVTDELGRSILCLPLHSRMRTIDIERVVSAVDAVAELLA